jgi:hypothetical protein
MVLFETEVNHREYDAKGLLTQQKYGSPGVN